MATGIAKRPEPLDLTGNMAEAWRVWIDDFEIYLTANEVDEKADKVKIGLLLNHIGADAREKFGQFTFDNADDKKKYDVVKTKFREYCAGKTRTVFQRYLFWTYVRPDGQSFLDYIMNLRKLADQCKFTEKDNMIRDKVVFSMTDRRLQERLVEPDDITLDDTIKKCVTSETTKQEVNLMSKGSSQTASVKAVKRSSFGKSAHHKSSGSSKSKSAPTSQSANPKGNNTQKSQVGPTNYPNDASPCTKCGSTHPPKSCPAFGRRCAKCGRRNHYAKMCTSNRTAAVLRNESSDSDYSDSELCLGSVLEIGSAKANHNSWWQEVSVDGSKLSMKVDSGAQANIISYSCYKKLLNKPPPVESKTVLSTVDGTPLKHFGKIRVTLSLGNRSLKTEIYVVKRKTEPILGLDSAVKLKILKPGENSSIKIYNLSTSKPLTMQDIKSNYADVFDGKLGKYPGTYNIELTDNAVPRVNPPRRVPFKLREPLHKKLCEMEDMGVIEKVDHPTEWVNSMVGTEKKNGTIRLCLDPRELNKFVKREHYPIPTFDEVKSTFGKPKYFTIVDQSSAFWQVELEESCRDLTTFQTPTGRYRFKRLPFGLSSASEVLQRKTHQVFGDLPNVFTIADDTCIIGETEEAHDEALVRFLQRARENNIKLNADKLQFKKQKVVFHGHQLTEEGIKADKSKIDAIVNMPEPQDRKGVQRFLGMINYLSPFIPCKSQITDPLRQLVKDDSSWMWGPEQRRAFQQIKSVLLNDVTLDYFDPKKELTIQADASKDGLGACLLQDGRPLAYASRPLSKTECRYAQIEKELLAIVFATRRFHHYVYGTKITVQSDHKPLVSIQHKDFDKMSPRLQLMCYKLLRYNFEIKYQPGSTMYLADTLSRAVIPGNDTDEVDPCLFVNSVMTYFPATKSRKRVWKEETLDDNVSQSIKDYLKSEWPNRKNLPSELVPYYDIRDELFEEEDLLFYVNRLIIPAKLRKETLEKLHEGHQGMEKCKNLARERIYWPGITKDIENFISQCAVCQKYRKKNAKEPIQQREIPDTPWNSVATDIFQFGKHDYLVMVDYYSKYPEIARLTSKTATAVVNATKIIFARHGIPFELIADNMPFASVEYRQFAQDWGFKVITSSPRYPQSNGEAERYVGIVKTMMLKCAEDHSDPNMALLRYRNTPLTGMTFSPAQLLFSRRLRDDLPQLAESLHPEIPNDARQELLRKQERQAYYYNRGARKRTTADFKPEDNVRIKVDPQSKQWVPGKVEYQYDTPRSYVVTTDTGDTFRRNRSMLNKTAEDVVISVDHDSPSDVASSTNVSDVPKQSDNRAVETSMPNISIPVSTPNEPMRSQRRSNRERKSPAYLKDYVKS